MDFYFSYRFKIEYTFIERMKIASKNLHDYVFIKNPLIEISVWMRSHTYILRKSISHVYFVPGEQQFVLPKNCKHGWHQTRKKF